MTETTPTSGVPIHPLWLRLTHWLNALAVLVLVTSGWRIYNASPLFDLRFANDLTLGGWLGGRLYVLTGSYDVVWWMSVALAVVAALLNIPIRETPVARLTSTSTSPAR